MLKLPGCQSVKLSSCGYAPCCVPSRQIAAEEQQLGDLESAHKAAQIEVTRAADDLKALQTEGNSVAGQWQDTIEACTR
jgi:hypothetical protein